MSASLGSFLSRLVIASMSSVHGEVKGWCFATNRSSSSSHSSMGKLTTHRATKPSFRRPKSVPIKCRNLPMDSCVFNFGPARMSSKSPGSQPPGFWFAAATHALYCSSVKNFFAEQSNVPSLLYFNQTRALAPTSWPVARFSSSLTFLVDHSAMPLQHIATTISASSKSLKSRPFAVAVMSTSSMLYRRSGLSMPNLSMASLNSMRWKGGNSWPTTALKICRIMPSKRFRMSSCVMKDISQSICVNSGWRSARSSSSRKHLTIWKYRSIPATISNCLKVCGDCGKA
mmetsp:Transcript_40395/g.116086  ORF Transcript_40395/g.116086 Transcript_40395/m.116086 type:complete len:286 (+) Transcript_40395:622-1479(+)